MTVEAVAIIDPMTEGEARRLTTEALSEFRSAVSHHERGWQIVAQAIRAGGHEALGYRSASDYLEHEFAQTLAGLDVSARRVAVRELSNLGMSTRAIAPVVGVSSPQTVVNDLRASGVQRMDTSTPDPLAEEKAEGRVVKLTGPGSLLHSEPVERIDMETGEVLTEPHIIGRDGKTYTRPEVKGAQPRRRPLVDQAQDAAVNLTSAIERLARIFADDRLPQNREQVASVTRSHLLRTAKVCQDLASQLPN